GRGGAQVATGSGGIAGREGRVVESAGVDGDLVPAADRVASGRGLRSLSFLDWLCCPAAEPAGDLGCQRGDGQNDRKNGEEDWPANGSPDEPLAGRGLSICHTDPPRRAGRRPGS